LTAAAHRPMAAGVALDPTRDPTLDAAVIGEVIQMALSDHVGFAEIRAVHGLTPDQVKALMRSQLSAGSYRSWRRRVRRFSDRRAHYK